GGDLEGRSAVGALAARAGGGVARRGRGPDPDPARRHGAQGGAVRRAAGRILVLSLLATPVLPAQDAPPPSPSADEVPAMLARARQLIDQGSPSAAVQLLAGAPAVDPRVRVLMGVAHYHANDPLPAIEELAAVLPALPPDSAERREAIQVLGLSHYLAGHLVEAIPFLEQARAFAPDSSDLA